MKDKKVGKLINVAFWILVVLTIIIDILVILEAKDACASNPNVSCGFAYNIVTMDFFNFFMWVENVLGIVISIFMVISGIFENKIYRFIFGILNFFIQPIVWVSIFNALNIPW